MLDFCPLLKPDSWLIDVLDYLPLANDIDLQQSSIRFVQDLREAQNVVKTLEIG